MVKDDNKKTEELKDDEQHEELIAEDAVLQQTELEELEAKVEEYEDKWKRALADYRNLEQRVSEQRSEWIKSANRDLLLRLLPILDTLMLAKTHSDDKNLSVSVEQFFDILKNEGVTQIETMGKEFDPMLMECIAVVEGEDNKVLEELRAGFILHDKVLRPAGVKVGKKE